MIARFEQPSPLTATDIREVARRLNFAESGLHPTATGVYLPELYAQPPTDPATFHTEALRHFVKDSTAATNGLAYWCRLMNPKLSPEQIAHQMAVHVEAMIAAIGQHAGWLAGYGLTVIVRDEVGNTLPLLGLGYETDTLDLLAQARNPYTPEPAVLPLRNVNQLAVLA